MAPWADVSDVEVSGGFLPSGVLSLEVPRRLKEPPRSEPEAILSEDEYERKLIRFGFVGLMEMG